jgi:hypothetical protein
MAYSSAQLGATDIALAAADKPLLIGLNMANPIYENSARPLKWTTTGFANTGDSDDADGPGAYGCDFHTHLQTYPDSAANTWYYNVTPDTSTVGNSIRAIDSFILLNHNLGTLGATVAVEIADSVDFTSNLIELVSVSPSDDTRIVELELYHTGTVARRYTNIAFARLKITGSSIIPKFGEVILGRRRQLKINPLDPWDPLNLVSGIEDTVSLSGVRRRYSAYKGQRKINAVLSAHETVYIDDLEAFYQSDTQWGTQPFVWIDQPATAPEAAYFMHLDSAMLSAPQQGPSQRLFSMAATEQGPHFVTQE